MKRILYSKIISVQISIKYCIYQYNSEENLVLEDLDEAVNTPCKIVFHLKKRGDRGERS